MNLSNEKFAMIALDLPGRVLPRPTGRLLTGDLLQLVGKARQFGPQEVEISATSTAVVDFPYIPILRRRRR